MQVKDYCTLVPDYIKGVYVGDCCKKHDNMVGEKGTYNPFTPHIVFFKCMKSKVSISYSLLYAVGGTLGSWLKYPYFAYKKYNYRKQNEGK